MLNTLDIFELPELTDIERLTYAEKQPYFRFGGVGITAILAGVFVVPLGIFMAGRTESPLRSSVLQSCSCLCSYS